MLVLLYEKSCLGTKGYSQYIIQNLGPGKLGQAFSRVDSGSIIRNRLEVFGVTSFLLMISTLLLTQCQTVVRIGTSATSGLRIPLTTSDL